MAVILENLASIIVLLIVTLVVSAIIFKMIKDKKQGKTSCGCGCNGCPNSSFCHQNKSE